MCLWATFCLRGCRYCRQSEIMWSDNKVEIFKQEESCPLIWKEKGSTGCSENTICKASVLTLSFKILCRRETLIGITWRPGDDVGGGVLLSTCKD